MGDGKAKIETVATIIGIIVGVFTIIGGLYAFFTKTTIGNRCWTWLTKTLGGFGSFVWRHKISTIVILFSAALLVTAGFLTYWYWWSPQTKSITGIIYYRPCEGIPGLDPASNVTVFVSERRELKSEPTGSDGKFIIRGVPVNFQMTHLTAQVGGQDFAPVDYKLTGDYAIIPRPCETPPDIRDITTRWTETAADQCFPETEAAAKIKRRYLLNTLLPPAQGKHEAILTVELQNAPNVTILNAFVLLPTQQSGLYRNATVPGQNRSVAHSWVFTLAQNGLNVQLEVCLGSNVSSAASSQQHLHTYYELR